MMPLLKNHTLRCIRAASQVSSGAARSNGMCMVLEIVTVGMMKANDRRSCPDKLFLTRERLLIDHNTLSFCPEDVKLFFFFSLSTWGAGVA